MKTYNFRAIIRFRHEGQEWDVAVDQKARRKTEQLARRAALDALLKNGYSVKKLIPLEGRK